MSFDINDPADLLALKNEVTLDPEGLGYVPDGPTQAILDLINEKNPATLVSKPRISAALVRSNTTFDAWDGLLAPEESWMQWVFGSNGFQEENIEVTADLRARLTGDGGDSVWANADEGVMEPRMLAIIDVPGSRAEILFGFGEVISSAEWQAARDS